MQDRDLFLLRLRSGHGVSITWDFFGLLHFEGIDFASLSNMRKTVLGCEHHGIVHETGSFMKSDRDDEAILVPSHVESDGRPRGSIGRRIIHDDDRRIFRKSYKVTDRPQHLLHAIMR